MRPFAVVVFAASLFVFVASPWVGPAHAGDKLIPLSPAQRGALRIATAPLVSHAGAVSVGMPAVVRVPPAQERVVAAPLGGLITEVKVAVGDQVKAGQTLAVLRGEDLGPAQRELSQAAIQLQLAESRVGRDEALFREGIIPESRLLQGRAELAQARAAAQERRAWLRLMGLSDKAIRTAERGDGLADHLALSAPLGGVVVEQTVLAGARVESAQALFRVARLTPLWLEIQAPSEIAALVKPGQKVTVPGSAASGSVVSVGHSVSPAQTVLVRARVNNPGDTLRLNQNVAVRLEGLAGAKQWRVPVRAIVRLHGQQWVFVEQPGGFEPQAVQVLSQSAQSAAVEGGFSGDEKVAVEGVAALKAAWQGLGSE